MSVDHAGDLAVIVPTRLRPHQVAPMAQAFADTATADTWLLWCLDDSPDAADYLVAFEESLSVYPRQRIRAGRRRRLVATLNHYALACAHQSRPPYALGFFGDDHRPATRGWDTAFLRALRALGSGLVYGDDTIQGENLPTQVAITTDIVVALGHMAPGALTHMYLDNYWLDLGRRAQAITYLPDVTITHEHHSTGAAPLDASYAESNSAEGYARDKAAYNAYVASGALTADVERVRAVRRSEVRA